jgi:hypothetical protein
MVRKRGDTLYFCGKEHSLREGSRIEIIIAIYHTCIFSNFE